MQYSETSHGVRAEKWSKDAKDILPRCFMVKIFYVSSFWSLSEQRSGCTLLYLWFGIHFAPFCNDRYGIYIQTVLLSNLKCVKGLCKSSDFWSKWVAADNFTSLSFATFYPLLHNMYTTEVVWFTAESSLLWSSECLLASFTVFRLLLTS